MQVNLFQKLAMFGIPLDYKMVKHFLEKFLKHKNSDVM